MSIQLNQAQPSPSAGRIRPWLALAVVACLMVVAALWLRGMAPEEALARHRAAIALFVDQHRIAAVAAFVLVYTTAVLLSFPGAMVLTICGGLIFGGWIGAIAAVVAATLGAIGIFLIARTVLGSAARCALERRAGPLVARLAARFRTDAFCYLLFLRLVPVFPYWLVNLVAAVGGVGLAPFAAATAIGIIPATVAYANVGAGLDHMFAAASQAYLACLAIQQTGCHLDFDLRVAATPQLLGSLAVLGLVALAPLVLRHVRSRRPGPAP